MNDLISKSAAQAIPPLPKCYREYATSNLDDAYDKGWEDALFSLNALPTIDAVPVVRCKDCKHYDESGWGFGKCHLERWGDGWANYPPPSVSEDGFCKWGGEERR